MTDPTAQGDIVEQMKRELESHYIEGDQLRPIIESAISEITRLRSGRAGGMKEIERYFLQYPAREFFGSEIVDYVRALSPPSPSIEGEKD